MGRKSQRHTRGRRPVDRTPLYLARPQGILYANAWVSVDPDVTMEDLDADERLTDELRAMAATMVRWKHLYLNNFPDAAFALQEQLDSGWVGFGAHEDDTMLSVQEAAAMLNVPVEEVHAAMHELHAAALFVLDDEGVTRFAKPPGLLVSPPKRDKEGHPG